MRKGLAIKCLHKDEILISVLGRQFNAGELKEPSRPSYRDSLTITPAYGGSTLGEGGGGGPGALKGEKCGRICRNRWRIREVTGDN
jgi:hypothetical protein